MISNVAVPNMAPVSDTSSRPHNDVGNWLGVSIIYQKSCPNSHSLTEGPSLQGMVVWGIPVLKWLFGLPGEKQKSHGHQDHGVFEESATVSQLHPGVWLVGLACSDRALLNRCPFPTIMSPNKNSAF